jgi:hypothetical protein
MNDGHSDRYAHDERLRGICETFLDRLATEVGEPCQSPR